MRAFRTSAVLVGLAVALAAPRAQAQEPTSSALFAEGQRLMSQGKYHEACPKFEKALAMTSGAGTKFNLADCSERIGKLTTALTLFREVEDVTKQVGQLERSAVARQRADALEARIPTVIVRAPWLSATPRASVTLDGRQLTASDTDKPIRVDLGEHVAIAKVDGIETKAQATFDKEGEQKILALEQPKPAPVVAPTPVKPAKPEEHAATAAEPASPGGTQRTIGLVAAGAGVIALGVGTVLVLGAKSDYDDATSGCGTSCPRDQTGRANDARDAANLGGVVLGVGLAALAAGGILFFSAPSSTKSASASLRVGPGILSAVGTF